MCVLSVELKEQVSVWPAASFHSTEANLQEEKCVYTITIQEKNIKQMQVRACADVSQCVYGLKLNGYTSADLVLFIP